MLDPLYQYMRPFELARTVNVRSSTAAHYIDLPYAASLWVSGRIIASPVEPCSTVWVVVQMTMLKYWGLAPDTHWLPLKLTSRTRFTYINIYMKITSRTRFIYI